MYVYTYIHTYIYIYAIKKTMCPPSYHHNGFVATSIILLIEVVLKDYLYVYVCM